MQNSKLQFKIKNFRNGFTLIELLVVISIIGLLAGFLMVNFVGVRQRARDATRKSDLGQILNALELYRSDVGSYKVVVGSPFRPNDTACPTSSNLVSGTIVYMQRIPCDPLGSGTSYNGGSYFYQSNASGTIYALAACIENSNDTGLNVTTTNPGGSGSCSSGRYYVLQNP